MQFFFFLSKLDILRVCLQKDCAKLHQKQAHLRRRLDSVPGNLAVSRLHTAPLERSLDASSHSDSPGFASSRASFLSPFLLALRGPCDFRKFISACEL